MQEYYIVIRQNATYHQKNEAMRSVTGRTSRNSCTYLTRFIYSGNEQQLTAERQCGFSPNSLQDDALLWSGVYSKCANISNAPRRRRRLVFISSSIPSQQLQDPVRKWRRRGRCTVVMLMLVLSLSLISSRLSGEGRFSTTRGCHKSFDGMIHGSGDPCRLCS